MAPYGPYGGSGTFGDAPQGVPSHNLQSLDAVGCPKNVLVMIDSRDIIILEKWCILGLLESETDPLITPSPHHGSRHLRGCINWTVFPFLCLWPWCIVVTANYPFQDPGSFLYRRWAFWGSPQLNMWKKFVSLWIPFLANFPKNDKLSTMGPKL